MPFHVWCVAYYSFVGMLSWSLARTAVRVVETPLLQAARAPHGNRSEQRTSPEQHPSLTLTAILIAKQRRYQSPCSR